MLFSMSRILRVILTSRNKKNDIIEPEESKRAQMTRDVAWFYIQ